MDPRPSSSVISHSVAIPRYRMRRSLTRTRPAEGVGGAVLDRDLVGPWLMRARSNRVRINTFARNQIGGEQADGQQERPCEDREGPPLPGPGNPILLHDASLSRAAWTPRQLTKLEKEDGQPAMHPRHAPGGRALAVNARYTHPAGSRSTSMMRSMSARVRCST